MSDKDNKLLLFAVNLIRMAATKQIELRLLGGLAVFENCNRNQKIEGREPYADIDFVGRGDQNIKVSKFFKSIGFERRGADWCSAGEFHNYSRWIDELSQNLEIEIYFGQLEFNHYVPKPYLTTSFPFTLPVTQLLLSKWAIVELTRKDVIDIGMLLLNFEIQEHNDNSIHSGELNKAFSDGIRGARLARTCQNNLVKIRYQIGSLKIDEISKRKISEQLDVLEQILNQKKRSIIWEIRDRFGFEKKWYKDAQPRQVDTLQHNNELTNE